MAVIEVSVGWFARCSCGWLSPWFVGDTVADEFHSNLDVRGHRKRCEEGTAIGAGTIVLIRPPVGLLDPRVEGPEISLVRSWR